MDENHGWIRPLELPNIGIVEIKLSDEQFNYVKQCIENKCKNYRNRYEL